MTPQSAAAPSIVAKYENTRSVKALGTRSIELAALQNMDYAISFLSAEGQTALDTVNGQNSPFAEAFATNVREKQTFFDAVIETRRTVRSITDDRQRPTLEMSWDEDLALSSNLIKSVSYTFLEPVAAIVSKPSADIVVNEDPFGAANSFRIHHKAGNDDGCSLDTPTPNSARFSTSSFDCLTSLYALSVPQNKMTGTKFDFPMFNTRERDGAVGYCEEATFVLDLDLMAAPKR